ncbi:hypothetical protein BH11CYA1_BH11CYA1_48860 [soil metagenome]
MRADSFDKANSLDRTNSLDHINSLERTNSFGSASSPSEVDSTTATSRAELYKLRSLPVIKGLFEKDHYHSSNEAIRGAERAFDNTTEALTESKNETQVLPKLEIHFDDTLNYFAEHSLVVDRARRIGYDFEHNPQMAKALWGGLAVTLGAAAVGIGILKNPTAAAYLAGTGSEALGFGAVGGMAGGSAMQHWYTTAQLRDQLPSSRLPEFKAVRMHGE